MMIVKNTKRSFVLFIIIIYLIMTAGMCFEKTNVRADSLFCRNSFTHTQSATSDQIAHLSDIMAITPEDASIVDSNNILPDNYSITTNRFKFSEKLNNHYLAFAPIPNILNLHFQTHILANCYKDFIQKSQDIIVCYIHHQDGKKTR